MSTSSTGAVGPVSVRYAAQIRDLLYAQALQRLVADQESARARSEAERAARVEPADKPDAPSKVQAEDAEPANAPVVAAAPADQPAPTGQLLDIHA